ncbi:hypothetical protein KV100_19170 [Mumia sp. zg.B21]|uniref:hypothetical protein n=1 Tax=Mumia sp. zg.B21 TaxID=2855447 RepID=UPI001C6E0401|nr:hypothetical protein [Mumia sp. zg.B21]MBW9211776.1 hypothetical protein [Mumia sp. zg.B21]
MKKRMKAVLATVGLVASAGAINASPASAAACGPNPINVYITGGESHYTIRCANDGGVIYVTVEGWLKDTKSDGKCIQVKAWMDSLYRYSNKACPKGEVETFSWRARGSSANVYTYAIG